MRKVYIYALTCPVTNEIRYIGKTIQKLNARLNAHMGANKDDYTYRANWIRSLKDKGLRPTITLIEECTETNWEEREIYWICFYSKTCDLTNYTKGGNGGHHVKLSTKQKLSLVYKEKWQDEEYRTKMTNVSKELWEDDNHRKEMSNIRKEQWKNKEYREKMSNMSKELWKDKEYRDTRMTEDGKERIRQAHLNTVQLPETKNKIGTASKKLWKENKEKWIKTRFKKAVIINGIEYDSMKKASTFLGVDASTITKKIKSDKYPNFVLKLS